MTGKKYYLQAETKKYSHVKEFWQTKIIESAIIRESMVADVENIIRIKRKELGLSQEELAKRCGVSGQTVNAIENNKYDPTLALAFSLAKELHVTVDELFRPV